jgi:flagellar hook-associated protein 3 FlgL
MISSFDPASDAFLTALSASKQRTSEAMQQISTGYRVRQASDAPSDVTDILRLNSLVGKATQTSNDLAQLRNEADIAESTISTSVNLLENALQIGVQATDITLTAQSRGGLALQVQQLHQQIVNLTQIRVGGRYVFSGDRDQAPQYSLNPTDTTTGVTRNFQTAETRQLTDILGGSYTCAMTAEEIYDHRNPDDSLASDNAFQALEQLNQALLTNNAAGIEAAVGGIKLALDHINSALSFYGSVQNRIASSATLASKYQVDWQKQLGEKRDADILQAATQLQAGRTQQDAAMAARANFYGRSLFDFLK